MSAQQQIAGLLDQWLQLTLAEEQAIEAAAWSELKRIQSAKAGLQPPLNEATAEWAAEHSDRPLAETPDHPFRAEVNRLITLEAGNGERLAARIKGARQEILSRETSCRNLRRVHGSYARKPEAVWNSYS